MKVEVTAESSWPTAGADLRRVGLFEGDELPGRARRRAPAPTTPRAASRSSPLLRPDGLAAGARRRARQARGARRRAAARRRRARRQGGGAAGGDARSPGRCRRRDDAEVAADALVTGTILAAYRFDRFKSGDGDDDAAAARVADAARRRPSSPDAAEAARVAAEAAEPRPRPADLPANVATPTLPRRARRGDRRRLTRRSRSRCSAAPSSSAKGMGGLLAVSQGGAAGAEADRAPLQRRRLRPDRSASSARASPSTPAASRSSPAPRCRR